MKIEGLDGRPMGESDERDEAVGHGEAKRSKLWATAVALAETKSARGYCPRTVAMVRAMLAPEVTPESVESMVSGAVYEEEEAG